MQVLSILNRLSCSLSLVALFKCLLFGPVWPKKKIKQRPFVAFCYSLHLRKIKLSQASHSQGDPLILKFRFFNCYAENREFSRFHGHSHALHVTLSNVAWSLNYRLIEFCKLCFGVAKEWVFPLLFNRK